MFRFFGGAPKLLVPDNLKSGVIKASFYDPEINRTYGAMAAHYSVGILPARPRRPRDKAKVEAGVRFAQTYILGRLRHLTFFSLAECNAAIALVMQRMNERTMRKLGVSRRELFETSSATPSSPCPPTIGSSRNGGARGSISTITSRSMTFFIRPRMR
jgi:transposase